MEIKVSDLETIFEGDIVDFDSKNGIKIKINDTIHTIKIIEFRSDGFEFMFDDSYNEVKVLESTSTDLKILLNGSPLTLKKHSKLAEVIEKSSGRGAGQASQNSISSQIPGRVISISVSKGDSIKKGDNIVVLESMKMQVAVKSPRDGVVKELKVKEGQSISRNDVVATLE
ncbi:MAG: acetyl-CoA carboxylase biotin carboxyl carrier protein subunit [Thermoproteota archaeon]|nr:acetyl-CoA carboxylase biotin carboxyl carrier protein subunit [Thermoproteota archaeon]